MKTIKNNEVKSNKNASLEFDYYDFFPINNGIQQKSKNENNVKDKENDFFTRIPNKLAKANLESDYGIKRIVLVVFILIHRNMSVEERSFITIRMILEECNYICKPKKMNIFHEVVKAIFFLVQSGYIEISELNPQKIKYDDPIFVTVIPEFFLPKTDFTKLYWNDLDTIMMPNDLISNESLLNLFLYISAVIGCRPKNEKGEETLDNPSEHPEAFWQSAETMCKKLSMSKRTVNDGLNILTDYGLLVKRDLGFVSSNIKRDPHHYPNIYVLDRDGFEQEIEWAISIVLKECNRKEGDN